MSCWRGADGPRIIPTAFGEFLDFDMQAWLLGLGSESAKRRIKAVSALLGEFAWGVFCVWRYSVLTSDRRNRAALGWVGLGCCWGTRRGFWLGGGKMTRRCKAVSCLLSCKILVVCCQPPCWW